MRATYRIEVEGREISPEASELISSLEVQDEIGRVSDSVSIRFLDPFKRLEIPPEGRRIKVFLGRESADPNLSIPLTLVGRYYVGATRLQKGVLSVTAKGFLMRGEIKASRTESYENTTIGAIVQKIAQRGGLKAKVSPIYLDQRVAFKFQDAESDLSFLDKLARESGATFKIQEGELLFIERIKAINSKGRQLPTIELPEEMILDFDYQRDTREEYTRVKAKFFDQRLAKEEELTVGSGSLTKELKRVYASREEADREARSYLETGRLGQEELEIETFLDPRILCESPVLIKGVRAGIDGRWIASSVSHSLSRNDFKTRIILRRRIEEEPEITEAS
jgi:phage protein D